MYISTRDAHELRELLAASAPETNEPPHDPPEEYQKWLDRLAGMETVYPSPDEIFTILSHFVNSWSSKDGDKLAQLMADDHPTLQQGFVRFFMKFVTLMAAKPYTDLRNEGSVQLCRKILALGYNGLPRV